MTALALLFVGVLLLGCGLHLGGVAGAGAAWLGVIVLALTMWHHRPQER